MHEAHLLIEEHGGFLYSIQEHLAGISEDVAQMPMTCSSPGKRLDQIINTHRDDDNSWVTDALAF